MKFRQTKFWQNYEKFDKIVGNSSMRCTIDAIMYWKIFQHFKFNEILEIGVYQGLTSGLMLENSNANLIGVDPNLKLDVFNSVFTNVFNRATFISSTSQDFSTSKTFDFILIDGDHTVDVVYKDLEKFTPLLSKTGILAIDDYDEVLVPKTVHKLRMRGLVPFIQAEQTEFWHYADQDRSAFLDNLLLDKINQFILLYNVELYNCTVLKAKTIKAFTDNIELFDRVLALYDV